MQQLSDVSRLDPGELSDVFPVEGHTFSRVQQTWENNKIIHFDLR